MKMIDDRVNFHFMKQLEAYLELTLGFCVTLGFVHELFSCYVLPDLD